MHTGRLCLQIKAEAEPLKMHYKVEACNDKKLLINDALRCRDNAPYKYLIIQNLKSKI